MDPIIEFLALRERLNHSYVRPKLLMLLEPNPQTVFSVLSNPKIWYQIKLRIKMLFSIGAVDLQLECTEAFSGAQMAITKLTARIDQSCANPSLTKEEASVVVTDCNAISSHLTALEQWDYAERHEAAQPETLEAIAGRIRASVQSLSNHLTLAMRGEADLRSLGFLYWLDRCGLEHSVIRQFAHINRLRSISREPLRRSIQCMARTDWMAEEVLSLELSPIGRRERVAELLVSARASNITELFTSAGDELVQHLTV